MAYVVPRRNGTWEVRESTATKAGPRSRTLATFRTLSPEVIDLARARSRKPITLADVRSAALRAGAPLATSAPDRAARDLLTSLASGERPRPVLRRLLAAMLGNEDERISDTARAATSWVAATPEARGEALRDLLLLADRLPQRHRPGRRFPRIESSPA